MRMLVIIRSLPWLLVLLLLLPSCAGDAGGTGDAWMPSPLSIDPAEEPDPQMVVRSLIELVQGQKEMAAEALVSYEAPQESGQMLEFDLLQRWALAKPDRLYWMTVHDDGTVDRAYFSDGTFTLHKHPSNVWGQVAVPPTVREMVDEITLDYEIDIPFQDLIADGELERLWLGDEVSSIRWIGDAWVEGHWTHHIAISRPGVDFELWVRQGNEPFPAKISIQYTDVAGQPSYVARFRKWSTELPEWAAFDFTRPAGSEQIEIVMGGE